MRSWSVRLSLLSGMLLICGFAHSESAEPPAPRAIVRPAPPFAAGLAPRPYPIGEVAHPHLIDQIHRLRMQAQTLQAAGNREAADAITRAVDEIQKSAARQLTRKQALRSQLNSEIAELQEAAGRPEQLCIQYRLIKIPRATLSRNQKSKTPKAQAADFREIMGMDRLRMNLHFESVDLRNASRAGNVLPPARTPPRVGGEVELNFGEMVVMSCRSTDIPAIQLTGGTDTDAGKANASDETSGDLLVLLVMVEPV